MNSASCSRPACPESPAAWLAYDYDARCAWLDDRAGEEMAHASRWPLCERHADNLHVPRGWSRIDRRTSGLGAGGPGADGFASALDGFESLDGHASGVQLPVVPGPPAVPAGGQLTAIL